MRGWYWVRVNIPCMGGKVNILSMGGRVNIPSMGGWVRVNITYIGGIGFIYQAWIVGLKST